MTTVDASFEFPRPLVAVVAIGAPAEAQLIRSIIEALGAVTLLHLPGTPEDVLKVLGQTTAVPAYMVFAGHGDETGFHMGEYGPEIDTSALVAGSLPSASIAPRVRLPGCVVVSTACMTGSSSMAGAMVKGTGSGVRAYIAPDGYPSGEDTLLFVIHFFHAVLSKGASPEDAWRSAASYDEHSRTFVLHTRDGVRRPDAD